MKNIVRASALLIFLFFVVSTTYAQFSQGTNTLGGGIGFETVGQAEAGGTHYRSSFFNLNLAGGFLLQDNVEAGFLLGYSGDRRISEQGNSAFEDRAGIFSIGPYARLYNPITDVVGLFGQASLSVGFGGGRFEVNNGPATKKRISSFEVGIQPGVILMVNENLGLEATIGRLGYSQNASGEKDNYEGTRVVNSSFRASVDLRSVSFGFRLYLRD